VHIVYASPRAYTDAFSFVKGNDIMAVARPLMQELADYTKAAVMLGASHEMHMVLLDICQGDELFQLKLQAGSRVPHSSTALGRAWLASLPQSDFDRYLQELPTKCPATSLPKIKSGIVRARRDCEQYGFCFSLGDWNPEVFAVGVPIVSTDKSRVFAFMTRGFCNAHATWSPWNDALRARPPRQARDAPPDAARQLNQTCEWLMLRGHGGPHRPCEPGLLGGARPQGTQG